jgi:hypothetical protein
MFHGLAEGAICSGDKAGLRVISLHDGPAITIFAMRTTPSAKP